MSKRPLELTWLATAFLLFALCMPVQVMLLYGHGVYEWSAIAHKMTWLNWMIFAGFLVNAVMLWRVNSSLRFSIPLLLAFVFMNNFVVGYHATDFSLWTTSLASIGFMTLHLPLLDERIRWIMRHPERRWWIRAERKRLAVPIFIEGTRLNSLKAETFDVSESGVFISSTRELGVGDWVHVRMQLSSLTQIRCQARVVRRGEAKGIYPAGVGVEFMDMPRRERRELRRHLERTSDAIN